MSKRSYTDIRKLEPEIIALRDEGKSRGEIAEALGLTWKQVDNWITRYKRRKTAIANGLPIKCKGHPRTRPLTTVEEYQKEIARLEMENKLLRDFLQSTERM